jgi:hypothetical protein
VAASAGVTGAAAREGLTSGEAAPVRRLCATVLIFEAIVIGLAIPVAITIEHEPRLWAGVAGGVLAGLAVLLAAVVGRPGQGWALAVGSLLQLGVIAAGLVVPAMYALGAVFAALWAVAIWLGLRYREAPRP